MSAPKHAKDSGGVGCFLMVALIVAVFVVGAAIAAELT